MKIKNALITKSNQSIKSKIHYTNNKSNFKIFSRVFNKNFKKHCFYDTFSINSKLKVGQIYDNA